MYGERGRIGLITLATDPTVLPEISRVAPLGVAVYQAPISLPRGEVTPEALREMVSGNELEHAAVKLAATGVGVILFACTSGSFVGGPGADRALSDRIETACGVKATTTSTAVLAALRAVGATRLSIATPYLDSVNVLEERFFAANGFAVTSMSGLGLGSDHEIAKLGPADAIRLAAIVDRPDADAIFISCTNFHALDAIAELEARFGKPVVTSNQAGAWAALRAIGINAPIPGFGRLLEKSLPEA